MLNASCRNTTGSYLGHRARKTDGCHYFKTNGYFFSYFWWMSHACLPSAHPEDRGCVRTATGRAVLSVAICLPVGVQLQRHRSKITPCWLQYFDIWECKNIQKCMYNDVCTGANALKHLGKLILFCLYMHRSFAVCIAIYYAADLFSLFYILLVSSHNWVIYLSSTRRERFHSGLE